MSCSAIWSEPESCDAVESRDPIDAHERGSVRDGEFPAVSGAALPCCSTRSSRPSIEAAIVLPSTASASATAAPIDTRRRWRGVCVAATDAASLDVGAGSACSDGSARDRSAGAGSSGTPDGSSRDSARNRSAHSRRLRPSSSRPGRLQASQLRSNAVRAARSPRPSVRRLGPNCSHGAAGVNGNGRSKVRNSR